MSYYFCPDEELNAHEELMIESLGTLVPDGYNLKAGGKSGRLSDAAKRKLSESQKGKTLSEAARAKVSTFNRGRTKSTEHRAKLSAAQKGIKKPPHSAEARAKMSAARKGKTQSEEHRAKIGAATAKRWAAWKATGKPISEVWAENRAKKAMETV